MHYMKMLVVSDDKVDELDKMHREVNPDVKSGTVVFDGEVSFLDNYRAVVQVVSCGDVDPAWSQAVLYSPDGYELMTTTSESFLGEYHLEHDDNEYIVIVARESDVMDDTVLPCWWVDPVQFTRLLYELQELGAFTDDIIRAIAERMDLSENYVMELLDRSYDRWNMIKSNGNNYTARDIVCRSLDGWSDGRISGALCDFISVCHLDDQLDSFLSGLTSVQV